MRVGLRAGLLLVVLLLAACGSGVDDRLARTCRIAAVGLAEADDLHVAAQRTLPDAGDGLAGVRIDFGAGADRSWIECRFGPAGPNAPGEPVSVVTPAGPLSDARLFFLKRYWLDTMDGLRSDPAEAEAIAHLPRLPFGAAYAAQQILNVLPNAAVYGLLAAAYSLVYGLFGRINLAFGGLAATGGFAALAGADLLAGAPAPVLLAGAGLFGIWASGFHGIVMERLVVWPLRAATGQQALVATVGVALFLEEYLRLTQGSQPKWMAPVLSDPMRLARAGSFTVTVTPLALVIAGTAAVASAAVLWSLRTTRFGREWRATSDDAGAAALFGVDPRALSLKTFALASALVGLAGAGVTVFYGGLGSVYTTTLALKALIAAIVGGIGSIEGAFLGGIGIALVEAAWSAYFPIVDRDFVIDGLLVATLVLRPGGLFGFRELEPRLV